MRGTGHDTARSLSICYEMVESRIYRLIWRFVAVICILTWGVIFVSNVHIYLSGQIIPEQDFISTKMNMVLSAVTILVLGWLLIYPLQFKIYAILCSFWGLANIVEGGGVTGLLMYILGVVFAYKSNFFKNRAVVKIVIAAALVIGAVSSQARYGLTKVSTTVFNFMGIILIAGLSFLLFFPEIRKYRKRNARINTTSNPDVIYLPPEQFTARDIRCIKRVQLGEKYESIAKDEKMGLSTLKYRMKIIFEQLDIFDRTTFLAAYAKRTILLGKDSIELDNAPVPVKPDPEKE